MQYVLICSLRVVCPTSRSVMLLFAVVICSSFQNVNFPRTRHIIMLCLPFAFSCGVDRVTTDNGKTWNFRGGQIVREVGMGNWWSRKCCPRCVRNVTTFLTDRGRHFRDHQFITHMSGWGIDGHGNVVHDVRGMLLCVTLFYLFQWMQVNKQKNF